MPRRPEPRTPTAITPPTPIELTELLATAPADTVISDRTAAEVRGLWVPRYGGIEVSTPAGARGSPYTTGVQRRAVTAHRRVLPPEAVATYAGLPVTTLEYTWLHLGGWLDIHDLIAAGDSALRLGASLETLTEVVHRAAHQPGVQRARQALPHLDRDSRSRPESRIRAAIVLAGLPKPAVNKPIHDAHGGWLAEPDLHYKEAKVALEYDGVLSHEGREDRDGVRVIDMQRDRWAVRVYRTPFAFQRLAEVPVEVHALLQERAPQLLARHLRGRQASLVGDRRRRIAR